MDEIMVLKYGHLMLPGVSLDGVEIWTFDATRGISR